MSRVYNFCAGPAMLPLEVLEQAQNDFVDYQGSGMSIMESSHRSKEYDAVHQEATANYKELFGLSDDYSVLLIQGGASMQFAMIPMNLLGEGQTADYTNSGGWAKKAIKEAQNLGNVNIAADCSSEIPTRVPSLDELNLTDNAAYLHVTSNETIAGSRWNEYPETDSPIVADMSSDIFSRPLDSSKFGLIYAGAQKNLGPAGCALVAIRNDLLDRVPDNVPTILKYKTHAEAGSLFNTPPCFTIYMMMLVTRWIKKTELETLYKQNADKAGVLYSAIDATDFYTGSAIKEYRSDMNVTFRIANHDLEPKFLEEATAAGLKGLKGHRSIGGLRASIYNAFPAEGVDALVAFMGEFEKANG
jgi:phosphoserine aminotransferase